MKKVCNDRVKECKRGNIIQGSETQFSDKHRTNSAYKLDEQNEIQQAQQKKEEVKKEENNA